LGRTEWAGSATVDAELDDRGHVPLEREHHRPAGRVVVDLAEVLERRPLGDIEDARQLSISDDRLEDRLGVVDRMPQVGQHAVHRAAEAVTRVDGVDDVARQVVDRVDRGLTVGRARASDLRHGRPVADVERVGGGVVGDDHPGAEHLLARLETRRLEILGVAEVRVEGIAE
jgi:hypothetical protein